MELVYTLGVVAYCAVAFMTAAWMGRTRYNELTYPALILGAGLWPLSFAAWLGSRFD